MTQHRERVRASARKAGREGEESRWAESEEVLSEFFRSYAATGKPNGLHLVLRARRVIRAVSATRRLPVLEAEISDSVQGRVVRESLTHLSRRTYKTGFVRTPLHEVAAVLILPSVPHACASGSSKQTVRRKSRAAEKAGVTWATVDDRAERLRLIELSEERERHHPQEQYRSAVADNSRLRDLSLWLVASSREGVPLLIAAVPIDGEWSILCYFRTLEDSPAASDARYLMSRVLAEQLVERGVRYLTDTATMSNLSDGLRHFQRVLGYRVVRVRVSRARRRSRPADDTRKTPTGDEAPITADLLANRS